MTAGNCGHAPHDWREAVTAQYYKDNGNENDRKKITWEPESLPATEGKAQSMVDRD